MLVELIRHELEAALRTRRVLVLLCAYLAFALIGAGFVNQQIANAEARIVAEIAERSGGSEELVRDQFEARSGELVTEFLDEFNVDISTLAPPVRSSPMVGVYFFCSLFFLPFLIVLSTFDRLSTNLRDRVLCYATMNASRGQIVIAKFISQWTILSGVAAIAGVAVLVWAAVVTDSTSIQAALVAAGWSAVVQTPLIATYVGLTLFCSSRTIQPVGALVMTFAGMLVLRLMTIPNALVKSGALAEGSALSQLAHLRWLSPSAYKAGLWQDAGTQLALSATGYTVLTVLFVGATIASIRRRDL